jgi:hypothetical protein
VTLIPTGYTDPADPRDMWALASVGYAPDKFYMWSLDTNGHGDVSQLKTPPNLKAMVMQMVGDEDLPYRTFADFARDAIVHRIRWLLDQQNTLNEPLWQRLRESLHREELAEIRRVIEERRQYVVDLWNTIDELRAAKLSNAALQAVDEFEDIVMEFEDVDARREHMAIVDQMRVYLDTGVGRPQFEQAVVTPIRRGARGA